MMQADKFVWRVRMLSVCVVLIGCILGIRLYFVQIVHGDEYAKDAFSQYVAQGSDHQNRGSIYFSDKDGTLSSAAVMQTGWRIAIKPKDLQDSQKVYETLNAIVPIDRVRFDASVAKKNDPYEDIAFRVPDDLAQKVRAKKLTGVILAQDGWRFYPAHELAAQTIGFVAYKGDSKVGVYGLERQWQNTLAEVASSASINPFAEIFTNMEAMLSSDPASHQGDIVTTIEPTVQRELESTLDTVMKTYTPRLAGGIVMDPHTGEIVAMALRPSFDLNLSNLVDDPATYSNLLVEGRYEMGSIMKPLTMAAGIDTGAITPDMKYYDAGCIERSGKKICNYDHKARNVVAMQEILSQSLNLGVTYVEEKMGQDVFGQYIHNFSLGEKTNIDLPNEVMGNIAAIDKGYDVDYASASFGQGIAVSPVQMIRALAALANNGKLPNPHVVKSIKFESGLSRATSVPDGRQVLKPETTEAVTRMLVEVVDKALLKGEVKQEHYSIAAKTGTAQIADPHGGGYYTDRYLHSFFGYFPAHDPKYIVFMYAVEPHGAEFASATLAKPFIEIAKFLINYFEIPPDR